MYAEKYSGLSKKLDEISNECKSFCEKQMKMTEDMYNTAGDKNPTSYAYDLTVTENNADIYSFYLT
mgnify:CR=1 FL=1